MTIYEYQNYKTFLKDCVLQQRGKTAHKLTFESLANACHVQKTYLSKVLNKEGHLNSDQLYRCLMFLKLDENEKEFLQLVYDHQTTEVLEKKKILSAKIEMKQRHHLKTEANIKAEPQTASPELLQSYYLDPYFSVIHMYLTIGKYQKEPQLIAAELKMPLKTLNGYLDKLLEMRVVEKQNSEFKVIKDNLHLPENSPIYTAYRSLMRIKSIQQMESLPPEKSYSFSALFSTDPAAKKTIHKAFLNFLKETQKIVQKGKETDVYQMNFDLFDWS